MTYVKGWGSFKSKNEVSVKLLDGGESVINAKNIMIATGSDISTIPGLKIDEERCGVLSVRHFLSLHLHACQ